jgi:hypothetical protein
MMHSRISTPFNRRYNSDRRKLVNGRWVKLDPAAAMALAWLKAEQPVNQRAVHGR